MEEDEEEVDESDPEEDIEFADGDSEPCGHGGEYSMPCSIDTLPLVADRMKLMGFKNECSSVGFT